jgi:hypothetical protein
MLIPGVKKCFTWEAIEKKSPRGILPAFFLFCQTDIFGAN